MGQEEGPHGAGAPLSQERLRAALTKAFRELEAECPSRPHPSHSAASRPPTNPGPRLGGTLAFLGSSSFIFFLEGPPNCLASHPPKLVAKTWGAASAGRRVRRHRWARLSRSCHGP